MGIDPENPYFAECERKVERKFASECNNGVIRAEAEVRLGGAAQLQAAIDRKEVQERRDADGVSYFFWKRMQHGREFSVSSEKTISKGKAISAKAYDSISAVLDSIDWNFEVDADAAGTQAIIMQRGMGIIM